MEEHCPEKDSLDRQIGPKDGGDTTLMPVEHHSQRWTTDAGGHRRQQGGHL